MPRIKSRPVRIDDELSEMIEDISKRNEIPFRQASKELAKAAKIKLKGNKYPNDIRF